MPWKLCAQMSVKDEFVRLMQTGNLSMSEVCRRYRISRRIGSKWLRRYDAKGRDGLDRQPA